MKRYLITSPKFTGEAECIYNAAGLLQAFDCSQTNMTDIMVDYFKTKLPVNNESIQTAFSPTTVIVESEIVITFEQWWRKYDYKFHKDRAEQLWDRLTKTNKVLAYYGLDKYHKHLRKHPGQDKQHPDTYLRTKGWENEY